MYSYQRGKNPKIRANKRVIDEARRESKTVHFATLIDLCHIKNAELEKPLQKNISRVVVTWRLFDT